MKKFSLTILGSNAAGPGYGRITSCQYLQYDKSAFLIDCGEASQIRISEYKLKANKIDTICISHLHGDHCFGLPGLLTSFSNASRKKSLRLIGPKGIKSFIDDIVKHTYSRINYPIEYIELNHENESKVVFENEGIVLSAFPLKHRVPTFGYRFQEKQNQLNIKKDAIEKYQLSVPEIKTLKLAKDVERNGGETIKWIDCCINPSLPRSYSYCSDTVYDEELIPFITETQFLYHETTYLDELAHLAAERMHSTSLQAGKIALQAKAGHLIIGHYSSRYNKVDALVDEAKTVFPNVHKGYDGFMIDFPKIKAKIDGITG